MVRFLIYQTIFAFHNHFRINYIVSDLVVTACGATLTITFSFAGSSTYCRMGQETRCSARKALFKGKFRAFATTTRILIPSASHRLYLPSSLGLSPKSKLIPIGVSNRKKYWHFMHLRRSSIGLLRDGPSEVCALYFVLFTVSPPA
jgi:hypothetical protein